jgi:AcrR family transcriptional regulator
MGRDERRASLLAAAARLVASRSGERLSFEAIAAEAGVSPTLPYKYFTAVEDVALELYTAAVADVDARTDLLLAASDRTFDTKVQESFLLWCDLVERDDFLFVRLARGAHATSLHRAVQQRRARAIEVWAAQVRDEFGADERTARLVAASVTAGASAVVQQVFNDRLDRTEAARLFARLVRAQCAGATTLSARGAPARGAPAREAPASGAPAERRPDRRTSRAKAPQKRSV